MSDILKTPSGFLSRPEGKTGLIIPAVLIAVGVYFFGGQIGDFLVHAFGNLLNLIITGTVICGLGFVLVDGSLRKLAFYLYKSLMRAITSAFINIDPILSQADLQDGAGKAMELLDAWQKKNSGVTLGGAGNQQTKESIIQDATAQMTPGAAVLNDMLKSPESAPILCYNESILPMIHTNYLQTIFNKTSFLKAIRHAKIKLKGKKFDAFAVSGNSGTLMGGALAVQMKKTLILVRKETDNSHSTHLVEGDDECSNYVFLDDCIATGATRRRVKREIEKSFPNCKCIGAYLYNDNSWNTEPKP